jgi:hypothetical protein
MSLTLLKLHFDKLLGKSRDALLLLGYAGHWSNLEALYKNFNQKDANAILLELCYRDAILCRQLDRRLQDEWLEFTPPDLIAHS